MSHRHDGNGTRPRPARGFTLVELLIAMTLTLMLVYAIARFYAYIGETVRDGRAQIEMGGQLRAASQRLQKDFAELTVRVGGRIETGSQMGYFEIVDGNASDMDPNGDGTMDLGDANGDLQPDGPMLGDWDDIIATTIRSEGEPFVGRQFTGMVGGVAQYALIQSNLAEVIWFTSFRDTNGNGQWDWDSNANGVLDAADVPEPRLLVRRLLLIRPDLTMAFDPINDPNDLSFPFDTLKYPPPSNRLPGENVFHHNDISAHFEYDAGSNRVRWVANSLGDLSRRENRFIHLNFRDFANNDSLGNPILTGNGLQANNMPNPAVLQPFNILPLADVNGNPINNPLNIGSLIRYTMQNTATGQFQGEDTMLSNVLAFDVRVYDPFAPLRADNIDVDGTLSPNDPTDDAHGVLGPCDPGYPAAILANQPAAPNTPFPYVGSGAYVDLWYTRAFRNFPVAQRIPIMQSCNSAYAWAPAWRSSSGGAAWDTSTSAYEKDGVAQFGAGLADQLVDGLDNNGVGGVDDPSEAETRPPYPSTIGENGIDEDNDGLVDGADNPNVMSPPNQFFETFAPPTVTTLRGIEVRIRMYEPGTRQTRQATVATDFIPE